MRIYMVVRTEKPMDEWVNRNIMPFFSESKAQGHADELTAKLSVQELQDYAEYVVEPHDVVE